MSWSKPIFKDNVGITKEFVSLRNNAIRGEHVYYVYYAASDAFNNEAVCRFFVHVTGNFTLLSYLRFIFYRLVYS